MPYTADHYAEDRGPSFPFACNIPAQTVVEEQALNPESEQEQLPMPNPKSLAASQEIADQSGPGDSLLSP